MKFIKSILCYSFLLFSYTITAQVRLPKIVSDGMVMQRDAPVNVWGWATPGEKVTVSFNRKTFIATTATDSIWKVQLPKMKAGGPYTMQITASNSITLNDILIGEVWLCAGQSNMVHQMEVHSNVYSADIAAADYSQIRHFNVPNVVGLNGTKNDLPSGTWKTANAENVKKFSAVAYFFSKQLHEKYKVPVGIINASWGGTPIEAWMSPQGLKNFPDLQAVAEKNKDTAYIKEATAKPKDTHTLQPDTGLTEKWYDPAYTPKGWRRIAIPGYWEDQGVKDLNGVVWYRRVVDVPQHMAAGQAKVFMGRIVDADAMYINGTQIGTTSYMYPQRRYQIPQGTLKPGKNLFVIRVTNNSGKGGFIPDKPYQLIANNDTLDITGYWEYKVGQVFTPPSVPVKNILNLQNQPTALYNAMLYPILNYSIKGMAWYQGESNASRAQQYALLQPAMVNDIREKQHNTTLPFLFVQLPGYMDYNYLPSNSQWALFREAQAKTTTLPHTAMAVAIDLGEWNDIHPDRKKEVGERLALAARKTVYGENIASQGPIYKSATISGGTITVSFDNAANGLATADGEAVGEFAIAGADKKFVWATAKIQGNKITLQRPEINEPKYVRYAWADNPVNPNLINKEGLPAAPFRTDIDE